MSTNAAAPSQSGPVTESSTTVPLPPASPTPPETSSNATRLKAVPRTIALFEKDGAPTVKFGAFSVRTTLLAEKPEDQVALLQHKNEQDQIVQLIGVVSRTVNGNRETVVFRFDPKSGDPKDVVGERWIEKINGNEKSGEKAKEGVTLAELTKGGQAAALKDLFDQAKRDIQKSQQDSKPPAPSSPSSSQPPAGRQTTRDAPGSMTPPAPPAPVAPRQSGPSMMLVPTDRKNGLGNPIYSLQLYENGRLFRQFDTVSGRRNTQNADRLTSGTQAPLPDGEYSVGVPVEGSNPEIGKSSDGKRWFIPTDLSNLEQGNGGRPSKRSALGIHLDPSFGLAQEDGTEGCVGLTNLRDWQEVLAWIKTKKPGVLKVNIL